MIAFRLMVLPLPGGYCNSAPLARTCIGRTHPEENQSSLPRDLQILVDLLRLVERAVVALQPIFELLLQDDVLPLGLQSMGQLRPLLGSRAEQPDVPTGQTPKVCGPAANTLGRTRE